MPPKTAPPPPKTGKKDNKTKSKEKKRHRINLKGWLKTPADWERFDAWAKINAQPRKVPEEEPIVRPSKPLWQMKKRIHILAQPMKKKDSSAVCRLDLSISKAALNAKPSKRIKKLAKFVLKVPPFCREFPIKIRKATMTYEPSERIIKISKPLIRISEQCKALEISQKALKHKATERERMMALSKKALDCLDLLSDEERDQLMTPTGIKKSAFTYKFTSWMSLLSLPSYRYLKARNDENAQVWKKKIIEESEKRGKMALEEKLKKEEKRKQKERQKKLAKRKKAQKESVGETTEVEGKKPELETVGKESVDVEEKKQGEEDKNEGEEDKTEAENTGEDDGSEEGQTKPAPAQVTEDQAKINENKINGTKTQGGEAKRGKKRKGEGKKEAEEIQEAKRRKAERNAWRFAPSPCKEVGVKQSALKGKVPPRVDELSKSIIRKDTTCRANPFGIKKSALSASASPRISELAKPLRPLDPLERPPPREKDDFGRPIFPKPVYGKVLPEVEYKEPECKTKEEEEPKEKPKKKRAVDPIAFMPTIDPYLDPKTAKRQKKARKKLAKRKTKSGGNDG